MQKIQQQAILSNSLISIDNIVDEIFTGQINRNVGIKPKQLEEFSDQQKQILEKLVKFSPYNTNFNWINNVSNHNSKIGFLKDNLTYLEQQQITEYNNIKAKQNSVVVQQIPLGIFISFAGSFIYSLMTKPSTKQIIFPVLKGTGLGLIGAYAYYRYREIEYQSNINKYFMLIIKRKVGKANLDQL